MLEPYEGKLSRTVLRGGRGSDASPLPDKEVSTKEGRKAEPMQTKTILDRKVAVKVSFFDGKNKKKSTVEVKYGDLDSELKGKPVQFCLF